MPREENRVDVNWYWAAPMLLDIAADVEGGQSPGADKLVRSRHRCHARPAIGRGRPRSSGARRGESPGQNLFHPSRRAADRLHTGLQAARAQ